MTVTYSKKWIQTAMTTGSNNRCPTADDRTVRDCNGPIVTGKRARREVPQSA